jgi:hypothetical protein
MGCWIQLQEGLHRKEPQTRVLHLAEILWDEVGRAEQPDPGPVLAGQRTV